MNSFCCNKMDIHCKRNIKCDQAKVMTVFHIICLVLSNIFFQFSSQPTLSCVKGPQDTRERVFLILGVVFSKEKWKEGAKSWDSAV